MVFDLQDVGGRFYTYLLPLHLVMEACAENSIPLIILDRPNPNGHYVDGPIMEEEYKGFLDAFYSNRAWPYIGRVCSTLMANDGSKTGNIVQLQ